MYAKFGKIIIIATLSLFTFNTLIFAAGPFEDVPFDYLNGNAIGTLKELGIIKEDSTTGLFAPERVLNRAEFAKQNLQK